MWRNKESQSTAPGASDAPRVPVSSGSPTGTTAHAPVIVSAARVWLPVKAEDASPFVTAFKASPVAFHEFRIEQRVGKEIRSSTLTAQIVEIEEGPKTWVLIRPNPQSRR